MTTKQKLDERSLSNVDITTKSCLLLEELNKWEEAMDFSKKADSMSKSAANLKVLLNDIYEADLKLLKDFSFSWDDILSSDDKKLKREDFIKQMQYLNFLIESEMGLFVKFDKLKDQFNYENICMYLRLESQNIISNPYVAVQFKLYFSIHFYEITKFAISINSNHLSKFDILSRCLIRYNTNIKVKKRDEKKMCLVNIIDAVCKFLDNGIWDFNKWWTEYPMDLMEVSYNDIAQNQAQTGLNNFQKINNNEEEDNNSLKQEAPQQKKSETNFNIEMTSQYINLRCVLDLLEFGLYPLRKIDELIEKLRENSSAIFELSRLYADDETHELEIYRFFIKECKNLLVKIILQIIYLLIDSYVMHKMESDNGVFTVTSPFQAQKVARVNIINITINYIFPISCKRNIPPMPNAELLLNLVMILGGSNADPYIETVKSVDEKYLSYIYKFDEEEKIDSDVRQTLEKFEYLFMEIEFYLSSRQKSSRLQNDEDTDKSQKIMKGFMRKKTIADLGKGTMSDENPDLAPIQRSFKNINKTIVDYIQPCKKNHSTFEGLFNVFEHKSKQPINEIYKYKFLANGVLHYYMLSVYYLRKILSDDNEVLIEMVDRIAELFSVLSSDTMFGNWQFFDQILDNQIFKDLLDETPVFCMHQIHETVAKNIYTYNDATLVQQIVIDMLNRHIGKIIKRSANLSMADHIFLMYSTEILQKCLDYMKNRDLGKRTIEVPFGLQVQQIFANLIEDMVLPFFSNQKTIEKIHKNVDFKNSFFSDMDTKHAIRQSFIGELKVDNKEIFRINARLNYKILKLFNLSSSVYLSFQVTEKIRQCLFKYDISVFKRQNYSYVGLLIKSEIVNLNMHYRIFYLNQVLTNRSHFFKNPLSSYYCEMEIISDHLECLTADKTKSAWIWVKNNLIEIAEFYKLLKHYFDEDKKEEISTNPGFFKKTDEEQLDQNKKRKSQEVHNPEFNIKKEDVKIIGDYMLNYLQPALYKYVRGCLTINIEDAKDSSDYLKTASILQNMKKSMWGKIDYILDMTIEKKHNFDYVLANIVSDNMDLEINESMGAGNNEFNNNQEDKEKEFFDKADQQDKSDKPFNLKQQSKNELDDANLPDQNQTNMMLEKKDKKDPYGKFPKDDNCFKQESMKIVDKNLPKNKNGIDSLSKKNSSVSLKQKKEENHLKKIINDTHIKNNRHGRKVKGKRGLKSDSSNFVGGKRDRSEKLKKSKKEQMADGVKARYIFYINIQDNFKKSDWGNQ